MTSCPNISKNIRNKITPGKTVSQLLEELKNPPNNNIKTKRLKPDLDINLIRS